MNLPGHVFRWRRWKGWTQKALAARAGVGQSDVSRWETNPDPDSPFIWRSVPKMARAFGFSDPREFLNMTPPEGE